MSVRMTEELHAALDLIFSIWPCIDLAFSLPSGSWIRPDAIDGKHRRLAGLDRPGVQALERELWARALSGGGGIHWRPACADRRPADVGATAGWTFADAVMLDDLDEAAARGITGKYRSIGIETSPGSYQTVVATARGLTRLEQHKVQSALVQRLHAAGRHADAGATGAGQYARMPGFGHPGHAGRTVRLFGDGDGGGALLLDPDALLSDGCGTPRPARAFGGRASACSRPGVPARPQGVRGKAAEAGPADAPGGSERDYAWTCAQIRAGADPQSIIGAITTAALTRKKRSNEAGCMEYAERTIRNAQARIASERAAR